MTPRKMFFDVVRYNRQVRVRAWAEGVAEWGVVSVRDVIRD